MEALVEHSPQLINLAESDESKTALHLAALRNHCDVLMFLLQQVRKHNPMHYNFALLEFN